MPLPDMILVDTSSSNGMLPDGTKPLTKPMLIFYELYHWEQISQKIESKYEHFHSRKCIRKCRMWNASHVVQLLMY